MMCSVAWTKTSNRRAGTNPERIPPPRTSNMQTKTREHIKCKDNETLKMICLAQLIIHTIIAILALCVYLTNFLTLVLNKSCSCSFQIKRVMHVPNRLRNQIKIKTINQKPTNFNTYTVPHKRKHKNKTTTKAQVFKVSKEQKGEVHCAHFSSHKFRFTFTQQRRYYRKTRTRRTHIQEETVCEAEREILCLSRVQRHKYVYPPTHNT